MTSWNKEFGKSGEEIARDYLMEQGAKIVVSNYQNRYGEIDLIIQDGDTLAFVEVKTRDQEDQGTPFDAITPSKQNQIIRMAKLYIQEKEIYDQIMRFDVVGIVMHSDEIDIDWLKDAFRIA